MTQSWMWRVVSRGGEVLARGCSESREMAVQDGLATRDAEHPEAMVQVRQANI